MYMEVAPPVHRRGYYDKKGGDGLNMYLQKEQKVCRYLKSVYPAIIVSIKFSSIA